MAEMFPPPPRKGRTGSIESGFAAATPLICGALALATLALLARIFALA